MPHKLFLSLYITKKKYLQTLERLLLMSAIAVSNKTCS